MGSRAALGPGGRLSIPSSEVGLRRARAEASWLPWKARTLTLWPRPCGEDNSGQVRRSGGPPRRATLAGEGAQRRRQEPGEGPGPRREGLPGVGSDNCLALGVRGPPGSPPPPQPPRPSREGKPKRPPAAAPAPAPPGPDAERRQPLTAAGPHLELRADTWAARGRAGWQVSART